MNSIELKAIDFFCGAGGMSYGLSRAGIDVIAGIDIDGECKETYEINNPTSKFIHCDIRRLDKETLGNLGIEKKDNFLLFAGCSPCQHWTKIRTNKNNSLDTKLLLDDFREFVEYFIPGFIIIENVQGILRNEEESKLAELLVFLRNNKYTVDYDVINIMYYGIPQHRKRFLLVASRVNETIRLPGYEKQITKVLKDIIGTHNGFPTIAAGNKDATDFMHTTAKLTEANLKRLRLTPHDGGNRLSWKNDKELQLKTYKGKDDTYSDTYGRMYWDKPAPTITTKFHSISNGRFAHPEEDRGISLREGATIQTFPKTYVFRGSGIGSIAKQIGNAVPPLLAMRLGEAIIK